MSNDPTALAERLTFLYLCSVVMNAEREDLFGRSPPEWLPTGPLRRVQYDAGTRAGRLDRLDVSYVSARHAAEEAARHLGLPQMINQVKQIVGTIEQAHAVYHLEDNAQWPMVELASTGALLRALAKEMLLTEDERAVHDGVARIYHDNRAGDAVLSLEARRRAAPILNALHLCRLFEEVELDYHPATSQETASCHTPA